MKLIRRYRTTLALIAALILPTALTATVGCSGGCANPERTAYVSTGVVAITVDNAMNGWGDYVRAGKATPEDELKVKAAYGKYQTSIRAVKAAVLSSRNSPDDQAAFLTALNALDAAKIELINLIISLKKG